MQGCASKESERGVKSQREGRATESIFRVPRTTINRWKKPRVNLSRGTSKNSNNHCPTTEIRIVFECRSRPMDNVPIIGNAYERGRSNKELTESSYGRKNSRLKLNSRPTFLTNRVFFPSSNVKLHDISR